MLAIAAFLTASVIFAVFSFSTKGIIGPKRGFFNKFSLAYYMLSLAFLIFGIAAIVNDKNFLDYSVLAGDFVIYMATGVMLAHVWPKKTMLILGISVILSVFLLVIRYKYYYPVPALYGGILYFNTQILFKIIISGMLLLVWLPSSLIYSRLAASYIKSDDSYNIYLGLFSTLTLSSIFFLSSRTKESVITTFAILMVSALALLSINFIVGRMKEQI